MKIAATLLTPLLLLTLSLPVQAANNLTHRVKKGESLYLIARKTKVSVEDLLRLNNLSSPAIKPGQVLVLQAKSGKKAKAQSPRSATKTKAAESAARQSSPAKGKTHRVAKGESLYKIAKKVKVPVAELQRINGLATTEIKPGQILLLHPPQQAAPQIAGSAPNALPDSAAAPSQETYRVAKGDNLYQIAKKTRVSVENLVRLNALAGTNLKPGQELRLAEPATPVPITAATNSGPEPAAAPAAQAVVDATVTAAAVQPADPENMTTQQGTLYQRFKRTIAGLLATPYKFGGNGKKGIDCSGFVQRVFRDLNIALPRSAREQFNVGTPVERKELQEGDLLFFHTYAKYPSHVGIYLGDNKMVHASTRSRKVVITNINQSYYRSRYIGAKRLNGFAPGHFDIDEIKDILEEERDEAFGSRPTRIQRAS